MIKHVLFLIHILKEQNAMKLKFTLFPVIKNTIKGIAFKNACIRINYNFSVFFICQHSCRIYSYAPTFFGTKHPWIERIQCCFNGGPSPWVDNSKILIIQLRLLKRKFLC